MSPRNYLCPDEEVKYAHASSSIGRFGAVVFGSMGVVIICALATAPSSFQIPKDNNYNSTWETILDDAFSSSRSWIINREGRNVTFERDKLLKDRMLKRLGMKRINFGTTWNTYCWNDPPSPSPSLPSLLRLIEFRPLTQAALRLSILLTIIWRMVFIYFRVADLKAIDSRRLPLAHSVASLGPCFALADAFCSFWVLLLHQDADSAYKDFMPLSLVLFGLFAALHMLIHLLIDFLEKNKSLRVLLRVVCLGVLLAAMPYSAQLQLEFLRRKTCTPYVPFWSALPDYLVSLSLLFFSSSLMWESPNVVMYLTTLPGDYGVSTPNYTPAMNIAA